MGRLCKWSNPCRFWDWILEFLRLNLGDKPSKWRKPCKPCTLVQTSKAKNGTVDAVLLADHLSFYQHSKYWSSRQLFGKPDLFCQNETLIQRNNLNRLDLNRLENDYFSEWKIGFIEPTGFIQFVFINNTILWWWYPKTCMQICIPSYFKSSFICNVLWFQILVHQQRSFGNVIDSKSCDSKSSFIGNVPIL